MIQYTAFKFLQYTNKLQSIKSLILGLIFRVRHDTLGEVEGWIVTIRHVVVILSLLCLFVLFDNLLKRLFVPKTASLIIGHFDIDLCILLDILINILLILTVVPVLLVFIEIFGLFHPDFGILLRLLVEIFANNARNLRLMVLLCLLPRFELLHLLLDFEHFIVHVAEFAFLLHSSLLFFVIGRRSKTMLITAPKS